MYKLVDTQTGEVLRTGSNASVLRRSAERKNQAYGAFRYTVGIQHA